MDLNKLFEKHKSETFIFVKPGGNWGDDLIYLGAEHLAEQHNIKFKTMTAEEFLSTPKTDKVIYLHGGGGYNPWCTGRAYKCLKHACESTSNIVIQGPCTASKDKQFLDSVFTDSLSKLNCKSLYFYTREKTTFNLLQSFPTLTENCQLLLDKDTAFYTNINKLKKKIGYLNERYTLHGYRIDNEASNVAGTKDITKIYLDPAEEAISFDHWLRIHSNAKSIITNRTHSSILGFLLDKKTYLFGSKYHKNRSIFEHTMSGQTTSVTWLNDEEATKFTKQSILSRLIPSSIHHSYRLTKAIYILRGIPDR